jgi:hypothetical protein
VTEERGKAISFSEPMMTVEHRLFIKNPVGQPNFKAYIEPLKQKSWIAIVIIVLLGAPILSLIVR